MRSSSSSFYTPGKEINISQAQKDKIRSRPFSGKFKNNNSQHQIVEDKYEQVDIGFENIDRKSMQKIIQDEQEKRAKLDEFEKYLSNMDQQFGRDIDSLVDENDSREELQRQILDNNYMKEKLDEKRMNESIYSERSDTSMKAITYNNSSRSNIYKPPMPYKPLSESKNEPIKAIHASPPREEQPDTVESIESKIAKQIELFHKVKNECLNDCSDFMDEFEHRTDEDGNKLINIPEDFDDIVDIAVDEQEQVQAQAITNDEVLDENGKPFWMRYFKADYLGETDPNYEELLVKAGIKSVDQEEKKYSKQEVAKLQDELMKIKALDKQLVNSNKLYKNMKHESTRRETEARERLEMERHKAKKKLEKKKKSYINSNHRSSSRNSSRSKRSNKSKTSAQTKQQSRKSSSKGFSTNPFTGMRRPGSGKKTPKQQQEEDKSNTFLTGIGATKMNEIDERIKNDLDFEVKVDDEDNAKNRNYELELINAYEETLNQPSRNRKKFEDITSEKSFSSNQSDDDFDFIQENRERIGPEHHKSYLNKLTNAQRQRLEELEDDIETSFFGNEETAKQILSIADKPEKERLELMSALVPPSEAGKTGVVSSRENAYNFDDAGRMEEINDQLKTKFLALPSPDDDISQSNDDATSMSHFQTSVMGDKQKSDKEFDIMSERSQQLTQISKRSGISSFSYSVITKLNKPVSLPGDKNLREKAEDAVLKRNLKEIDECLSKAKSDTSRQSITETQMSKLVDQ